MKLKKVVRTEIFNPDTDYYVNNTAPNFRNMTSRDEVNNTEASANLLDLKYRKMVEGGKVKDKTTNIFTIEKPPGLYDYPKLSNFRNMDSYQSMTTQAAEAGIGQKEVAKRWMIEKYLDRGNVGAAEYLLERPLNAKEMETGKIKHNRLKYFPKKVQKVAPKAPPISFGLSKLEAELKNNFPKLKTNQSHKPIKQLINLPNRVDEEEAKIPFPIFVKSQQPESEYGLNLKSLNDSIWFNMLDPAVKKEEEPEEEEEQEEPEEEDQGEILISYDKDLNQQQYESIQNILNDASIRHPGTRIKQLNEELHNIDPNLPNITNANRTKVKMAKRLNEIFEGTYQFTATQSKTGPKLSGRGISGHNKRDNIAFGKYNIDKNKLQHNVLSFTHQKNNHPVTNLPMSKISARLKKVILEIMSGLSVNLNGLNAQESNFLNYIISKSKQKFTNKLSNNNKELVRRLELLVGESNAGNNSTIIKNEISDILNSLHMAGYLSTKQLKDATKKYVLKR